MKIKYVIRINNIFENKIEKNKIENKIKLKIKLKKIKLKIKYISKLKIK